MTKFLCSFLLVLLIEQDRHTTKKIVKTLMEFWGGGKTSRFLVQPFSFFNSNFQTFNFFELCLIFVNSALGLLTKYSSNLLENIDFCPNILLFRIPQTRNSITLLTLYNVYIYKNFRYLIYIYLLVLFNKSPNH